MSKKNKLNKTIYSTGVFLEAMNVEINGIKEIRWVATSFEEKNFQDGLSKEVKITAKNFTEIIKE